MKNVKQQLEKVLKSALIFAMAFALCGTTLAKAYATYANIKVNIEHVWEDNHNKPDEGENEGPRDKVGEVVVDITGTNRTEETFKETVSMDGSETGESLDDAQANNDDDADYDDDGDIVTVNLDLNSVVAEESVQELAGALAPELANQVSDNSVMSLTEEQAADLAEFMADEMQTFAASQSTDEEAGNEGDIWKLTVGNYTVVDIPQARLTGETKEALGDNGYESKLTIKVLVTQADGNENQKGKTYVSTDGGETWTDMNDKDAGVKSAEELESELFQDGHTYLEITYTFTHTRAASNESEKKPNPKPNPVIPDPTDPDPVIPVPEEDIPAPEVPLAEPELPEEPEAEDLPEEVMIEEPDVPLADIPQTGDISDLWYAAALLAAAGLAALLYQDRRGKKTA